MTVTIASQEALDLALLTPAVHDRYDEFCSNHPDGIVYYSRRYASFLRELLGCEQRYWLAIGADGDIEGILPLMKIRAGNGNAVLNSLPFYGSHGGILSRSPAAAHMLLEKYTEETQASDVVAATIIEHPFSPSRESFPATFVDRRISQATAIDMPEEELLSSFDGSTRRNIKKAQRNNIAVRIDNDAWDFLRATHEDNMRAIGGKPKSPRFFEIFPQIFRKDADYNIFVAEHDGRYVSALLVLYYRDTVEYFVPVTTHDARPLQPLALIVLRAMVLARSAGYTRWNWGGTWLSQTGVYRFKAKFAAVDREYRYFTLLRDKSILLQSGASLSESFPGFFVVPYDKLGNSGSSPA